LEVFQEIERQFGVHVSVFEGIGGLFTGEFEKSDLNIAMNVVCSTMGLKYEVNESQGEVIVSIK
jgi:hypothetical protein